MKIKLDRYDLSILIKGLHSMRNCYDTETRDRIYNLLRIQLFLNKINLISAEDIKIQKAYIMCIKHKLSPISVDTHIIKQVYQIHGKAGIYIPCSVKAYGK